MNNSINKQQELDEEQELEKEGEALANSLYDEGKDIISKSNLSENDKSFLSFVLKKYHRYCFNNEGHLCEYQILPCIRNLKRFVDDTREDIDKILKKEINKY